MGVGRGRVASLGINTATATGSTDCSTAADRSTAADLSTAAGSSTDICSIGTAAGSSTGSSTARSTDICSIGTATGAALADTGTDFCRGVSRCWELGLNSCIYS